MVNYVTTSTKPIIKKNQDKMTSIPYFNGLIFFVPKVIYIVYILIKTRQHPCLTMLVFYYYYSKGILVLLLFINILNKQKHPKQIHND